nr:hypothetical protein [uncultured Agathobaculum sp.]
MAGRNAAVDLQLSADLTVKYTVSVTRERGERYKATNGYVNHIRFYLYAAKARKQVGKDLTASIPFTKKQFAAAGGKKPAPRALRDRDIQRYIVRLMQKNAGMSEMVLTCKKREVMLDLNQLFVYWMVRSEYLKNRFWPTKEKWDDACQRFAVLSRMLGTFDLSQLLIGERAQQHKVVRLLSEETRKTLDKDEDQKSATMWQYGRVIANIITTYLEEHDRSATELVERYRHELLPKQGVVALITRAMRTRVIPRQLYRQLYDQLKKTEQPIHEDIGLMLMVFLGLTAEEVCGLNEEDCQAIPYFTAIDRNVQPYLRLFITKRYEKAAGSKRKYELTDIMENACRYRVIPVPWAIARYLHKYEGEPSGKDGSDPMLHHRDGSRLRPDELERRLDTLFEKAHQYLTVQLTDGKEKRIDLALTSDMYQQSCRHFWQYYCGLMSGEIRYLAGLTPQDTAARHYIDFNNDCEQFRMAKQLEYGLAMLANLAQTEKQQHHEVQQGKSAGTYVGGIDKRVHVRIILHKPRKLLLRSNRGMKLYKAKEVWQP